MKKIHVNSRLQEMCWHGGPRVFRLFSGLVASIAVARHLGPGDFGVLCFATMVASLLAGLVQLGSLEVVTRTSAVSPEKTSALLRSALMLRLFGAMLGGLLLACIPFWFGHRFVYWILALFPLTLVPDCIEAAFYGRGQFRAMAPLRAASSVFGLVLRLALVFAEAGMAAFAAATILEGLVTGILFFTFRHRLSLPPADSDPLGALFLLRQSLPLVASGMIVAAMLKLDQFLLQTLRPGTDVGQYYVVVRLFEMAGVLIPSLVAALLPDLARLRAVSETNYKEKMVRIYRRAYQGGLLAALLACAVAPWVIPLVFGDQYLGSIPIFMAYSFAFPSFVIGSIRGMEFVVANKNENHLIVALFLFPLQAGLCSLGLIFFGPAGLAGAMAVVAFISTTGFSILLKPLQESGALQKKALQGIFSK